MNRSRLKRNQFTVSLLQEGLRTGIITSEQANQIQLGILQVLQQLIHRHTQGESTSVSTDTAEGMMASLLYAMDTYIFECKYPEEAIVHLKKKPIREIHEKGIVLLHHYFEETKQLYQKVKKSKLDIPVDAYQMTIDESLPVFLKHYNIMFEAQNTMASIDYPLAMDDMKLQGVFYIKQYLERLHLETKFCQLFLHEDLIYILTNFGKINRCHYQIELFNLFELVVNNAVFSLLSGGKANSVKITEGQFNQLNQMLMECRPSQRHALLHEATDQLQKTLQTDQELTHYLNKYRDELVQRVNNAVEIGSFDRLIIREIDQSEKNISLILHANDRMSDQQMRQLVDQVMEMDQTEEKVQRIRERVFSLYDYLDILDAHCLFDEEYAVFFDALENIELAILSKIVFYELLRERTEDFSVILTEEVDTEDEWKIHFIAFLQRLNKTRIQTIGSLIYQINEEDLSLYGSNQFE